MEIVSSPRMKNFMKLKRSLYEGNYLTESHKIESNIKVPEMIFAQNKNKSRIA